MSNGHTLSLHCIPDPSINHFKGSCSCGWESTGNPRYPVTVEREWWDHMLTVDSCHPLKKLWLAIFGVDCPLDDRELKILMYRFGLIISYPQSLEYVGETFNISRERVRQIEAKALSKLRHPHTQNA